MTSPACYNVTVDTSRDPERLPTIIDRPGGISFCVRVTPRARASTVGGVSEGVLWVKVSAPPVEGKANRALRGFLADIFGVGTSAVQISKGDRARHKVVEVRGVTREHARRALSPLCREAF